MVKTPEHEKLKKVSEQSQSCGAFIDWLRERGYRIIPPRGTVFSLNRELATFFNINETKLEAEKRAMLEELRKGAA